MKKNLVRVFAFVLVLILALGIIPLGALAAETNVFTDYYDKKDPTLGDFPIYWDTVPDKYDDGDTIEVEDYNDTVAFDGDLYDFKGFQNNEATYKKIGNYLEKNPNATPKEILEFIDSVKISYDKGDIKIDSFPTNPSKQHEWYKKWSSITAAYIPHQHRLSYWYSDSTTHWRECLVCKYHEGFEQPFMYQNWHSDGDEDRICDVCGADIPYHDVTVVDSKGGKITVNLEEAPHRKKITATVEAEDGYKLKKLHFTKVRDDGTTQEITRRKKNGEFWTYMPTYDLEVSAEFVKKK